MKMQKTMAFLQKGQNLILVVSFAEVCRIISLFLTAGEKRCDRRARRVDVWVGGWVGGERGGSP